MKTHLPNGIAGVCAMCILIGCNQNDYPTQNISASDRENEYAKAWALHFGTIAENQNWCLLRAVNAQISTSSFGEGVTTLIYNDSPADGGHVIALATEDGDVRFDLRKDATQVYVETIGADGNLIAAGIYTLDGEKVCIDGSATSSDAPASRYAHDITNGRSWFDAMIACEDLGFAKDSDFDFNDIVFGLQHVAGTKALTVTPMAAGGTIPANISITIGEKTYQIGESHDLIRSGSSTKDMLNTENPFRKAGRSVTITLPSADWTIADAWADKKISIRVEGKGEAYEVTPVSEGAAPKMICLGGDWYWPVEFASIDQVYPKFSDWAKGDIAVTKWVDEYTSTADVVVWQFDQVADNWFKGTTETGEAYQAKLNNAQNVSVNSGVAQYMYPAITTANMFSGLDNLTSIDITGDHFNTASVTSTSSMFRNCTNLSQIDLSNWDTGNLTSINNMFRSSGVKTLNLNGWDLSHIPYSAYCFGNGWGSSSGPLEGTPLETLYLNNAHINHAFFTQIDSGNNAEFGILSGTQSTLKTVEAKNCVFHGTDASYMFFGCSALENADLYGWNLSEATKISNMFTGCSSLKSLTQADWDVRSVTSMANLFYGCTDLTEVSLENWVTTSLTSTSSMFRDCTNLSEIDLSNWDTGNLTSISDMFYRSGVKTLNLNGWDLSHIPVKAYGFGNGWGSSSGPLEGTPLETLYINNAHLNHMFGTQIDSGYNAWFGILSGTQSTLNTVEAKNCVFHGTDASYMFSGCSVLESVDLTGWDLSEAEQISNMFYGCSSLTSLDLANWDVSKVTSMANLFKGCTNINHLVLDNWTTTSLKSTNSMFYGCSNITELNLSGWTTSNLTNAGSMFVNSGVTKVNLDGWYLNHSNSAFSGTPIKELSLNGAHLGDKFYAVKGSGNNSYYGFLNGAQTTLETIEARNCVYTGTEALSTFRGLSALKYIDASGWQTSTITSLGGYYYTYAGMFTGCSALETANLSGWDVSNVTEARYLFDGCTNLSDLNLSGWNPVSLTNAESMFNGCKSLTSLDLSGWRPTKLVTTSNMFANTGITELNLDGMDLSHVSGSAFYNTPLQKLSINGAHLGDKFYHQKGYGNNSSYGFIGGAKTTLETIDARNCVYTGTKAICTFRNLSALKNLNVSGWDTSSITEMGYYDYFGMFSGCTSLETLDLSGWDVSNVTDARYLFSGCSSLVELNLTGWDLSSLTEKSGMFSSCNQNIHITCSQSVKDKIQSVAPSGATWTIVGE